MAMERVAGTAFIKVDSEQLALRGTATINPQSVTRTGIAGMDGPHGYKEEPRLPSIELEIGDHRDLDLTKVQSWTGKTVTFEASTGRTYVLADAFQSGDLSLNGAEGAVTIRFEGHSMRSFI
jgi:hypothetical protein